MLQLTIQPAQVEVGETTTLMCTGMYYKAPYKIYLRKNENWELWLDKFEDSDVPETGILYKDYVPSAVGYIEFYVWMWTTTVPQESNIVLLTVIPETNGDDNGDDNGQKIVSVILVCSLVLVPLGLLIYSKLRR